MYCTSDILLIEYIFSYTKFGIHLELVDRWPQYISLRIFSDSACLTELLELVGGHATLVCFVYCMYNCKCDPSCWS